MIYYIYHIPGKKIGVTCDLNNRVTKQQGYNSNEYDILDQSEDIDYISNREIALQKVYGYKVDRKLYKNLKPITNMKINVTEQTTTFPCPVNKLKGQLMDNIGMSWKTEHGELNVTTQTIKWIMKNVKTSMYNDNRCYVYNKAFARLYDNNNMHETITGGLAPTGPRSMDKKPVMLDKGTIFDKIREWALVRDLYEQGDSNTQYVKFQEEAGELAKALLKRDKPEVEDAIGDIVVVLTNLAYLEGFTIEQCIESAYNVISKRTGKMSNGTFVKDE
jgi:NTP pyrophosphatase (non-canonical NTP hydrolase)